MSVLKKAIYSWRLNNTLPNHLSKLNKKDFHNLLWKYSAGLESSWVELLMSTWVSTWACSIDSYSQGFAEYPSHATHTHEFIRATLLKLLILIGFHGPCLLTYSYSRAFKYGLTHTHSRLREFSNPDIQCNQIDLDLYRYIKTWPFMLSSFHIIKIIIKEKLLFTWNFKVSG